MKQVNEMTAKKKKKKLGVFELSSCAGCQVEFLNLEADLIELSKKFDFTHFRFLGVYNTEAKIDVALVEGAVTTQQEIDLLKKVRENARFLVAFGTCASFGGVPAIKDYHTPEQLEKMIYGELIPFESLQAKAVDEIVEVDYYLRGCPIYKNEALEVLNEVYAGRMPLPFDSTVCFECKKRGNKCLFFEQPCMGSVIDGGCKALCPSQGIACFACRGPTNDCNLDALRALLKEMHLSEREIRNMYRLFVSKKVLADKSPRFQEQQKQKAEGRK